MGIVKSSGLVVIYDNKILLAHPTGNNNWKGTYSIPKGIMNDSESSISAAIRETKEEIGIEFFEEMIENETPKVIDYRDQTGKKYKIVYYHIIRIDKENKKSIENIYPVVPHKLLQMEEVNWAGFVDKEEAKKRIFWRLKPVLEEIYE